jgi:hypothetical protein
VFDGAITRLLDRKLRERRGIGNCSTGDFGKNVLDLFLRKMFERLKCGVCRFGQVACFLDGFQILVHGFRVACQCCRSFSVSS